MFLIHFLLPQAIFLIPSNTFNPINDYKKERKSIKSAGLLGAYQIRTNGTRYSCFTVYSINNEDVYIIIPQYIKKAPKEIIESLDFTVFLLM